MTGMPKLPLRTADTPRILQTASRRGRHDKRRFEHRHPAVRQPSHAMLVDMLPSRRRNARGPRFLGALTSPGLDRRIAGRDRRFPGTVW